MAKKQPKEWLPMANLGVVGNDWKTAWHNFLYLDKRAVFTSVYIYKNIMEWYT